MKQLYDSHKRMVASSATDDYIYDDRVKPGYILKITNVSCHWSDIGANEPTIFFFDSGGEKKYISASLPVAANMPSFSVIDIFLGEGERIGAYNPAITTNDLVSLIVKGILYDIEQWKKLTISL